MSWTQDIGDLLSTYLLRRFVICTWCAICATWALVADGAKWTWVSGAPLHARRPVAVFIAAASLMFWDRNTRVSLKDAHQKFQSNREFVLKPLQLRTARFRGFVSFFLTKTVTLATSPYISSHIPLSFSHSMLSETDFFHAYIIA